MRTEISAKFRPGGVRGWLEATGYEITRTWTDALRTPRRRGCTLATGSRSPPRRDESSVQAVGTRSRKPSTLVISPRRRG